MQTRPATRWAFPPPWEVPAPPDRARPSRADASRHRALLALLEGDLARGHSHVAARHYLMLQAQSLPVPAQVRERCEALLAHCPRHKLAAIVRQVQDWSRGLQ